MTSVNARPLPLFRSCFHYLLTLLVDKLSLVSESNAMIYDVSNVPCAADRATTPNSDNWFMNNDVPWKPSALPQACEWAHAGSHQIVGCYKLVYHKRNFFIQLIHCLCNIYPAFEIIPGAIHIELIHHGHRSLRTSEKLRWMLSTGSSRAQRGR